MTLYIAKKNVAKIAASALAVSILASCLSTGPTQYAAQTLTSQDQAIVDSKPNYLKAGFSKLFEEGKRNQVLNLMHIGKSALAKNNIQEAEIAFEQALIQIESVYADNKQAEQARSLWYEEGGKDFKGEPYERAMVYFYRGLVFLMKEDFDNARATFVSGLMQDAFAEEEQNRADFALLMFMAGWAAQKMGSESLATEMFAELKNLRPDIELPSPEHNVLVVAETGKSPRKLADGVGQYQLVYRRGKKIKDVSVKFIANQTPTSLYFIEDIYWQASSRGGRPVDSIIEGKAQFKQRAEDVGTALSSIGNTAMVYSAGSTSGTNVSAAISLIGVASTVMSANAKPRADIRYWTNLPDRVHVMTYDSAKISEDAEFAYFDEQGNVLFTKKPNVMSDSDSSMIIYSSNGI